MDFFVIAAVAAASGKHLLVSKDGQSVEVDHCFLEKYAPGAGDYFVSRFPGDTGVCVCGRCWDAIGAILDKPESVAFAGAPFDEALKSPECDGQLKNLGQYGAAIRVNQVQE